MPDHRRLGRRGQQQVEQPLIDAIVREVFHLVFALGPHHVHGVLDQVADHRLDIAPDIPDLGELRGLDLHERRGRELGEPTGDFRLPDAGRPDQDDVVRVDLIAHRLGRALAAPAISQRDGDRLLGRTLADDVPIEFGHDLAWRQVGEACEGGFGSCQDMGWGMRTRPRRAHAGSTMTTFVFVKMQMSPAMLSDSRTTSVAECDVCASSARAAARAYGPAAADGEDAIVGFDQFARAGQDEAVLRVGDREERVQAAQDAIAAPVLGQLHCGARQVAGMAFELLLESLEEREGVGRGAGKSGDDLAALEERAPSARWPSSPSRRR